MFFLIMLSDRSWNTGITSTEGQSERMKPFTLYSKTDIFPQRLWPSLSSIQSTTEEVEWNLNGLTDLTYSSRSSTAGLLEDLYCSRKKGMDWLNNWVITAVPSEWRWKPCLSLCLLFLSHFLLNLEAIFLNSLHIPTWTYTIFLDIFVTSNDKHKRKTGYYHGITTN